MSAVGNDLDNTLIIKWPLTLSLFGSNANINDGIPIVITLINVSCIGIKG